MSGFREFAQQKAPVDPAVIEAIQLAEAYLEEDWEEEFLNSIKGRVEAGFSLSEKQLDVLHKLGSGYYAELRQRRHDYGDEPWDDGGYGG